VRDVCVFKDLSRGQCFFKLFFILLPINTTLFMVTVKMRSLNFTTDVIKPKYAWPLFHKTKVCGPKNAVFYNPFNTQITENEEISMYLWTIIANGWT